MNKQFVKRSGMGRAGVIAATILSVSIWSPLQAHQFGIELGASFMEANPTSGIASLVKNDAHIAEATSGTLSAGVSYQKTQPGGRARPATPLLAFTYRHGLTDGVDLAARSTVQMSTVEAAAGGQTADPKLHHSYMTIQDGQAFLEFGPRVAAFSGRLHITPLVGLAYLESRIRQNEGKAVLGPQAGFTGAQMIHAYTDLFGWSRGPTLGAEIEFDATDAVAIVADYSAVLGTRGVMHSGSFDSRAGFTLDSNSASNFGDGMPGPARSDFSVRGGRASLSMKWKLTDATYLRAGVRHQEYAISLGHYIPVFYGLGGSAGQLVTPVSGEPVSDTHLHSREWTRRENFLDLSIGFLFGSAR